jgi:hypothetical protein
MAAPSIMGLRSGRITHRATYTMLSTFFETTLDRTGGSLKNFQAGIRRTRYGDNTTDFGIGMKQNVAYGCLHNAMSLLRMRFGWPVLVSKAFSG